MSKRNQPDVKESLSAFGLSGNKANKGNTGNISNTGNTKKRAKISRTKRTFPIEDGILETLERAAYWDRTDKNKIIETALEKYFKGKKYEEIPNGN